ncbi:MAG: hypothetical protein CSA07_03825 [Bacteroidia bacterium]|nr:MAG: hypothetical protein CSA07_03825 [Bacteroidia bacterium]
MTMLHSTKPSKIQLALWLAIGLCLAIHAPAGANSPPIVPFSRNDSASIQECITRHKFYLDRGNRKEASHWLNVQATIYWKHNYLRKAESLFLQSITLNESIGNQNGVAGINSNLAFIYADMGLYDKAYELFEKVLAVRRAGNVPVSTISALINESVVLNHLGRYEVSISRLEEALTLARSMNDEIQMRSVYGMLSETYQKAGDVEKAMYYYEYYKTFNDYVSEKTVAEARAEAEVARLEKENLRLQTEKQELILLQQRQDLSEKGQQIHRLSKEQRMLIDSLSARELANEVLKGRNHQQQLRNRLLVAEKEQDQQLLLFLAILSVLFLIGLLVVVRSLRVRNRLNRQLIVRNQTIIEQKEEIAERNQCLRAANEQLEERNHEIILSIEYSRQVQHAAMGHNLPLTGFFREAFALNQPLAIVSGDFYFTRIMPDGRKIIVVADCTGHGVPGGFLTVLSVTILQRAIYDLGINEVVPLLQEIDKGISELNSGEDISQHSMDLALCIIDERQQQLHFGGVVNGLYIANADGVEYIPGVRRMLGLRAAAFANQPPEFVQHTLPLKENTWYYMCSDGIQDQFNSSYKKFTRRRLIALLEELRPRSAQEQHDIILQEWTEWSQDARQVDDALLVGFKPL